MQEIMKLNKAFQTNVKAIGKMSHSRYLELQKSHAVSYQGTTQSTMEELAKILARKGVTL